MVVFGQKLLYSAKSGCFWAKVFVFGQNCCIRVSGCNRGKLVVCGQSGCIPEKVVVFGQFLLYDGKVVVFWQKWLYSDNVVVFGFQCCIRAKIGCI